MLALLIVGGFLAYGLIKTCVTGLMDQYTEAQPRSLPQLTISKDQARDICTRVDTFQADLQAGRASKPLVLTGNDINTLIQYHPTWNKMAGKIHVTIEDNKIRGDVSLPLELITRKAKGRYLNGMGVFNVQLMDGRLLVFLDALEVKGKSVPAEFMQPLRAENLAKNANTDAKLSTVLAKLESITVRNGQIRIVPKKTLR